MTKKELSPLEALERFKAPEMLVDIDWRRRVAIIERALKEYEEISKDYYKYNLVIHIIKKHKMVWFDFLFRVDSVSEYNKQILAYYDEDEETAKNFCLTKFEFNTLKEVLKDE